MPRPRRLLYFADATNVHTRRWVKHFVGLGYDVTVCTFDGTCCEGVPVFNLANRVRLPLKLHYLSHVSAVNRLVAAIEPDILHAHYASSYGLLGALARFHPFVLSVWGSDIFDFPRRSPLHASILRFNLSAADVVCSTSVAMARETKNYSTKPIVVTPFGIDADVYRMYPSPIRSTFTIGTVRKLETVYGIDILIRSFAILRSKHPEWPVYLTIVGDGFERRTLERLARTLGVSDRTNFVGSVCPSQVPSWLGKFDLFAALSREESFGVAVLEASACGLPVVVSDVGGLPEVVVHNQTGLVVPRENAEAAATAFARLVQNPELRESLGRSGRARVVQRFKWSVTAAELEAVYDRVLK